ncbi:putative VQ motif-containing protein [Helianthus debilis subsp. tardiflorus]
MDSSNSGSFQSSSGAGGGGGVDTEEYDSRTQSISSFFNPSNHYNPNLNHLLNPPPPPSSSSSSQRHNNQHHRAPPTDTTFFNPSLASPFSPNTNPIQDPGPGLAWTETIQPSRPDPHQSTRGSDHLHQIGVTLKNPKKRTRASRRAPTTVLTTDTTNFRQMVQEFTGIPTSPFATTPFSRRLDLFRPTAQKLQQPPPFLNHAANNITAATTSSSYQLQPSNMHEFQKQPSTLLDLQNPMMSFQSLLQTSGPQQPNDLNGLQSSSNSWRDQNEKLESGLENVVASRSGGDQVQGNQGSWILPSN